MQELTNKKIYERLKTVIDPELYVDIVSLGLIYEVKVTERRVKVVMTLTTPGCPLAPIIEKLIQDALAPLKAEKVVLQLVWEPAWSKEMMSEECRLQLGIV